METVSLINESNFEPREDDGGDDARDGAGEVGGRVPGNAT